MGSEFPQSVCFQVKLLVQVGWCGHVVRPQRTSQHVIQRRHEQMQLSEGAAVATDLRRLALHHVAQVLQLLAARSALLVSAGTKMGRSSAP